MRRAPAIHRSILQPAWEAAGLDMSVTITRAAGEAVDIGRHLDLATCDMLVAVGGDGTLHELLQVCRCSSLPPSVAHSASYCRPPDVVAVRQLRVQPTPADCVCPASRAHPAELHAPPSVPASCACRQAAWQPCSDAGASPVL